MAKNLVKYKYMYLFIIILSFIGFISGFFYYSVQSNSVKEKIIRKVDIKNELDGTINNIPKRLKESAITLGAGITILPQIRNIFKIFYEPFQIGFIFNILRNYKFNFSFLYCLIYHFIPLLFLLGLIRITFTMSITIIKFIFNRKDKKVLNYLKLIIKKYLLVVGLLLFYEFIVLIFSSALNIYLLSLL